MSHYIVCSGSRSFVTQPNAKELYKITEKFILSYKERNKFDDLWLIVGGAEGFDEACAKIAMRNDIPYLLVLPNSRYGEYYWRDNPILKTPNRYDTFLEIQSKASEKMVVSPEGLIYVNGVHTNHLRNNMMIDEALGETSESAIGLVCRIGNSPGTSQFMRYARSRNLEYNWFDIEEKVFRRHATRSSSSD